MTKDFITYNTVRNNALKLAYTIHNDGFIPDVIYVLLRGGAYLGNVFSEYFKSVRKNERPVFYAAVVARSYTNIREQSDIMIDGWTYNPKYLRNGDKVLLVDDIYDSGRTINYLGEVIINQGIPRKDLKIAVHDFKDFKHKKGKLPLVPDYSCRTHVIEKPEDDVWIHYMSHELIGLSEDELKVYYRDSPELVDIIKKQML
jgi:uncharacterized protein